MYGKVDVEVSCGVTWYVRLLMKGRYVSGYLSKLTLSNAMEEWETTLKREIDMKVVITIQ